VQTNRTTTAKDAKVQVARKAAPGENGVKGAKPGTAAPKPKASSGTDQHAKKANPKSPNDNGVHDGAKPGNAAPKPEAGTAQHSKKAKDSNEKGTTGTKPGNAAPKAKASGGKPEDIDVV